MEPSELFEVGRISLNCKDDKRYILTDNYNTLAHGHFNIERFALRFITLAGNLQISMSCGWNLHFTST